MRFLKASRWLLPFFVLLVAAVNAQTKIPEKPTLETSLYDYINLLSEQQKKALEQKLLRYADSTSTQIVVAVIGTTDGENINYLGAQWGEKWGIGQQDKDNGILVLLAKDDRRIAINTGYGVESVLTDALSKRIVEQVIIPEFKNGDYYAGLDRGADAIFQVLNGEFQETRNLNDDGYSDLEAMLPFLIFLGFFILMVILSRKNRKGGGHNSGGGSGGNFWDTIILSNMGRSGGSGGGFGGGGSFGGGGFGGGFGGGGFGGGGASGGW